MLQPSNLKRSTLMSSWRTLPSDWRWIVGKIEWVFESTAQITSASLCDSVWCMRYSISNIHFFISNHSLYSTSRRGTRRCALCGDHRIREKWSRSRVTNQRASYIRKTIQKQLASKKSTIERDWLSNSPGRQKIVYGLIHSNLQMQKE